MNHLQCTLVPNTNSDLVCMLWTLGFRPTPHCGLVARRQSHYFWTWVLKQTYKHEFTRSSGTKYIFCLYSFVSGGHVQYVARRLITIILCLYLLMFILCCVIDCIIRVSDIVNCTAPWRYRGGWRRRAIQRQSRCQKRVCYPWEARHASHGHGQSHRQSAKTVLSVRIPMSRVCPSLVEEEVPLIDPSAPCGASTAAPFQLSCIRGLDVQKRCEDQMWALFFPLLFKETFLVYRRNDV